MRPANTSTNQRIKPAGLVTKAGIQKGRGGTNSHTFLCRRQPAWTIAIEPRPVAKESNSHLYSTNPVRSTLWIKWR